MSAATMPKPSQLTPEQRLSVVMLAFHTHMMTDHGMSDEEALCFCAMLTTLAHSLMYGGKDDHRRPS